MARMKILTFTTLYPNAIKPHHGVFVETRLRYLVASRAVRALVVAPVPWFPSSHAGFGRYGVNARIERWEERFGLTVLHPRYPVLPKIGMTLAPFFLAGAMLPVLKKIIAEGYDFDLIDAHYFYPDGVAAIMLARYFGKPVVITARGTDINLIPKYRLPRKMILWAAHRASGIITVCRALKEALVGHGVPSDKITVLRNGVNLERFAPVDRVSARMTLGLSRPTLLMVGNLVELKGHHIAIQALTNLPEAELLIIGDGEEGARLEALAATLGVAQRVRFVGAVPQDQLRQYYGASDVLVLASSREGWPNVLLEAMACGTPVVATRVGGTPEIVAAPEAGILMDDRNPQALARAARCLFANYPDHDATRRYAERFGWEPTTEGQLAVFRSIMTRQGGVNVH